MKILFSETALNNKDLHNDFINGQPFPIVVIDNFLPPVIANNIYQEIENYHNFQKSNDYIFAKNKFENPDLSLVGPNCTFIKDLFLSFDMSVALSKIFGSSIFVDPNFIGGGLHRGGMGSFLDMHTDFNLHPINKLWIRELNLLLYLNKNWKSEYGGHLNLRNAITGKVASIEPLFNRLVIMKTDDITLHGYKPIMFPRGQFRTSIAAYAYSQATSMEAIASKKSTTVWAPENGLIKSVLAPLIPPIVSIKQKIFGSATARKK